MKKICCLLLLTLSVLTTQAQTRKITGIVTDASDGQPLAGVTIKLAGTTPGVNTGADGRYIFVKPTKSKGGLDVSFIGYAPQTINFPAGKDTVINIQLVAQHQELKEVEIMAYAPLAKRSMVAAAAVPGQGYYRRKADYAYERPNTEDYSPVNENIFHSVKNRPLSTFAADVDRASYSNIRRFLNQGQLPPKDAVRVEEMINYFDYEYTQPGSDAPVAIHSDIAICPWNNTNRLVRIGIQGKIVAPKNLPPSNLVFLLDVSGSMMDENKLPLVKQAFKALVAQLRPADKVAIVVYAGAAGLVLPSTSGDNKTAILDALDKLEAGGSTAGGAGIKLAYKVAADHFIKEGNNRVILATDGDFNVGASSDGDMQWLIEAQKDKGVFLSVLGFGMGNYKDNKLEILADKGNGNYAYIDNFEEARRTFVTEFGGTLFTIAKDVKLQVEFNPAYVQSYRLVGYENRLLNDEDFNDDKKDAGDMGAGHTVTALYEIVPAGRNNAGAIDPLKYQEYIHGKGNSNEVLTVKVRYKKPDGNKSQLLTQVLKADVKSIESSSSDFRMAAAVAEFGMLLRDSEFKADASYQHVLALAVKSKGADKEGYRAEFIQLVKKAQLLKPEVARAD